jgi:putative oxidoreductase
VTILDIFRELSILLGRILLSVIFLISGLGKLFDWAGTSAQMTREGVQAVPLLLVLAILFELGGGLSVLLGAWGRLGAVMLLIFLVPVTLIFHDFWTYTGQDRMMQLIQFLKNLAVMGGLLAIAGHGSGRWSIDGLRSRRSPVYGLRR